MALFGSVKTVRAQTSQTPAFATAWTYVEELLRPGSVAHNRLSRLAPGSSEKHELAHGVIAIEQAYETKPRPEGFFEAHRKFIDIQVLLAGDELMEVVDVAFAKEREAYQEARDLIVYEDVPTASRLRLRGGEAAVFFPPDVHMPSLRSGTAPVVVRKSVLKVPVAG
ncbi:YhcH/YjgK/YiaL family protein [Opitutus sp. ER46]|uniref:YhcH/YjgK/YiaL family protein n=1 Tax=Opitutus sp. ER46 TaxID=2161864 RepID=UPI000D30BB81|nr:YhcH/YjgK/YiaL family protein [Opitutus sp. ER46]PTY01068.1 YhcH/YjgK/YiaL family protein [Opitutus sp. ER46]